MREGGCHECPVGGADIRDGHRLLPIAADTRCRRSTSANEVVARRVVNAQVFVGVETREMSRSRLWVMSLCVWTANNNNNNINVYFVWLICGRGRSQPCALGWDTVNSLEIWLQELLQRRHAIRLILLIKLESVIDKYQTGVMSVTCDSPTDAISDWALCAQAFVIMRRLSSWLIWWLCVILSGLLRCGRCKCVFVSEQNDANVDE